MSIGFARLERIDLSHDLDLARIDSIASALPSAALSCVAEAAAAGDANCDFVGIACAISRAGLCGDTSPGDTDWLLLAANDRGTVGLRPGEAFRLIATHGPVRLGDDGQLAISRLSISGSAPFALHAVSIRRPSGQPAGMLFAIESRVRPMDDLGSRGGERDPARRLPLLDSHAKLAGAMIEQHARLAETERLVSAERETAARREVFIASLGHELRNPLAAINAATTVLESAAHPGTAPMLGIIRRSVDRLDGLVANIDDMAHGRFAGGLAIVREASEPLWPILEQVVAELRMAWPGRRIDAQIERDDGLNCDRRRIAQLLSNLLANALAHGRPDSPVQVRSRLQAGLFTIAVSNVGDPVPPADLKRIFLPFARGSDRSGAPGLGLGLYICSEIARAHGATLDVSSGEALTCFTFRMPTDESADRTWPRGAAW